MSSATARIEETTRSQTQQQTPFNTDRSVTQQVWRCEAHNNETAITSASSSSSSPSSSPSFGIIDAYCHSCNQFVCAGCQAPGGNHYNSSSSLTAPRHVCVPLQKEYQAQITLLRSIVDQAAANVPSVTVPSSSSSTSSVSSPCSSSSLLSSLKALRLADLRRVSEGLSAVDAAASIVTAQEEADRQQREYRAEATTQINQMKIQQTIQRATVRNTHAQTAQRNGNKREFSSRGSNA